MSDQNWFVDLPVEVSGDTLADDAVARLQDRWVGWEPAEGDAEVILIETLAPMAEVVARALSVMPAAALRAFGTKLLNVAYDEGSAATTTVTLTLTDSDLHVVPAGSEFEIDGVAFATQADAQNTPGVPTIAGLTVVANELGAAYNDLTGVTTAPISALAFVDTIAVDTATSGGSDPDDDTDYQNEMSRLLLLQAKTLVIARDYELWALEYADVDRALAENTGDRAIRVTLIGPTGLAVSGATKTALAADYTEYQVANNTNTIADATYTTIDVTYSAIAVPGFDLADVEARIDAMLADFLDPANWGRPTSGDPGTAGTWLNEPVVYVNVVIDRIADVEGVRRVVSVSLDGDVGSVDGDGNWTLAGTVGLTLAGTPDGTVTLS